ncbi:uncharacterized protein LOC144712054 [Wolffia australiana]
MKVHPAPAKKRNIAYRQSPSQNLHQKKLRRLPHVFSKVLELPFSADAHVSVMEDDESLRFVIAVAGFVGDGVKAQALEICPGVTKVVVADRGCSGEWEYSGEGELDKWRFRLPPSTLPELASAAYAGDKLTVTVPKCQPAGDVGRDGAARLILVQ